MSLFEKNLAALSRRNPVLAGLLAEPMDDSVVEVFATRDGVYTARLPGEDGRSRLLHSKYTPLAEAEKVIDRSEPGNCDCFIVYGFGFGYHVRELFKRSKNVSLIFVVEKDPVIIRKAMELVDLADVLASERVFLSVPSDRTELFDLLKPHAVSVSTGTQVIDHPPSRVLFPSFYRQAMAWVRDFMAYTERSVGGVFLLNTATIANLIHNLPYYLFSPGLGSLRERYAGRPAIIVSAGPSLHKNIDVLREAAGKALVIAVATTYKTLLGRGIRPDLVCVLDHHQVSKTYFDGVAPESTVPLVADPKASWFVLDSHRGHKFVGGNSILEMLVGELAVKKTPIRAGATVAHLAFYLAELAGADPVIFVGQDLSHPDGITHMPGTATHDNWQAELNRFNSIEMKEWEQLARMRELLIPITDIHGNRIYTDDQMFSYLQHFESDFLAAKPRTVIDATEGGARKSHTTPMTLREAVRRYCREPVAPVEVEPSESAEALSVDQGDRALEVLRRRQSEAQDVLVLFQETLDLLQKAQRKVDQTPVVNKLIRRIHAYRDRLHAKHERTFQLVMHVNQSDEMLKVRRDKEIMSSEATGVEKQRMQLVRDISYVRSLVAGTRRLLAFIDIGIARVSEYIDSERGREG